MKLKNVLPLAYLDAKS